MTYIVEKMIPSPSGKRYFGPYAYEYECVWEDGKPKAKFIRYLGKVTKPARKVEPTEHVKEVKPHLYYRGARPDVICGFASYFTTSLPEAIMYAKAYEGEVYSARIKPKRPLKAKDVWDAGIKLGLGEPKESEIEEYRKSVFNTAREKGYDAIDMDTWVVILDETLPKEVRKATRKDSEAWYRAHVKKYSKIYTKEMLEESKRTLEEYFKRPR